MLAIQARQDEKNKEADMEKNDTAEVNVETVSSKN
jgi:hypothetical protein